MFIWVINLATHDPEYCGARNRVVKGFIVVRYWARNSAIVIHYSFKIKSVGFVMRPKKISVIRD